MFREPHQGVKDVCGRIVAHGQLRFRLRQTNDAARRLHVNDVPRCVSTKKSLPTTDKSTHCASMASASVSLTMRNGHVFQFREFSRSEATRSGDHFILAFIQFAHQEWGQNALCFETGCILCRW